MTANTEISKKEYLKKYLTGNDKKKKKKKVPTSLKTKSKIVDDDLDLKNMKPIDDSDLEIFDMAEDAPQIVGIIDERPEEIRVLSEYRSTKKWKIVADEYGIEDIKITAISQVNKDDDRKEKRSHQTNDDHCHHHHHHQDDSANSDSDRSPPRKQSRKTSDLDASPPRKQIKKEIDSDASPPRKQIKKEIDSDASPPRQRNKNKKGNKNAYSHFNESPPRKNIKKESSPPRRRLDKNRKQKRRKHSESSNDSSSDSSSDVKSSKDGKSNKDKKTLSGKKAGLQHGSELKKESELFRKKQNETFLKMSDEISGRNAEVVIRDRKTGRKRDLKEEARKHRQKEEKDAEKLAQYAVWGKGIKQVEDGKKKLQDDLYEMSKPLARYADDKDLDEMLKNEEREGDPMLEYIRNKKIKSQSKGGSNVKRQYEGAYLPNRYGIRPGSRWDGVDRSNGYEKKWFQERNDRKAQEEEAFKWNTWDL